MIDHLLHFDLSALGIGYGTVLLFVLLIALLLTGIPLAFVTLLVALIFALGWFGPMAVPLITAGSIRSSQALSSSRCPSSGRWRPFLTDSALRANCSRR